MVVVVVVVVVVDVVVVVVVIKVVVVVVVVNVSQVQFSQAILCWLPRSARANDWLIQDGCRLCPEGFPVAVVADGVAVGPRIHASKSVIGLTEPDLRLRQYHHEKGPVTLAASTLQFARCFIRPQIQSSDTAKVKEMRK